jgi:hypothetical protein
MTGPAEPRIPWEPEADRIVRALLDMVPASMRPLAEATARDEGELAAQERGASEVSPDDAIRGWIRTTPPEQRNGLVAVIDELGYEPELYADDLGSAEGWDEEGE